MIKSVALAIFATLTTPGMAAMVVIDSYSAGPNSPYIDDNGFELMDGVEQVPVWSPTGDISGSQIDPLMGWQNRDPQIDFQFSGTATVSSVELWMADSDGARGVGLPNTITLRTPDNSFSETFNIVNPSGAGSTVRLNLGGFQVQTDQLIVEAERGSQWTMFSEISFFGTVPEPSTSLFACLALGWSCLLRRRR